MRYVTACVATALLSLSAAGCDEKLSDVTGPTPNLEPTFSSIQQNIFEAPDSSGRPACTSCHNAQFARLNGNLNLAGSAAYGQLVGTAASGKGGEVRVIPADDSNSYLVRKLEGGPDINGVQMPLGGPYLTLG
jgi:hypothetical protein